MATLENRTRPGRMLVYNIPADIAEAAGMEVPEKTMRLHNHHTGTGEKKVRIVKQKIPPAIRILSGESLDVHDKLLTVEEISRDLDRHLLRNKADAKKQKPKSKSSAKPSAPTES